jgi:hypothetical protein
MSSRIWSVVVVLCAALAMPAGARALASRTWVSGVGDDANPCSRTAPCKTFAGAIAQTAPGGEIDALDPGGFGALTITKAITVDGGGGQVASVLAAGTPAIVVAAGAADHVILRNLRFNGFNGSGTTGVEFNSGASLRIENSQIFGFGQSGVSDASSTPNSSLVVSGTSIDDNGGDGVFVTPASGVAGQALLENDTLEENHCGLAVGAFGANGATPDFTTDCGTANSGPAASGVTVGVSGTSASANAGAGIFANGLPSTIFLSNASVFGNATGLRTKNGGSIVSMGANNSVYGNGSNGSPTATVATGAVGPQGVAGSPGATGAPGRVVLVSCQTVLKKVRVRGKHGRKKTVTKKVKKCTARPVTGTLTFTIG